MKKLKSFLLSGCGYTVILLFVLYAFSAIGGMASEGIPFLKFLLLLGYGLLIPLAAILRSAFRKPLIAHAAHYLLLLCGFIAVYSLTISTSTVSSGNILIAVVLFTLLYFAIFGIKALIGKYTGKKKPEKENKPSAKESPAPYQSRFGG